MEYADSLNNSPRMLQLKSYADGMASRKPNGGGLPDDLKSGIESLSGVRMDGVKVHYNSPKAAQLKAHAFAQGSDIHLGPGQERSLPHEAWHVAQQAQGRVRPTGLMAPGTPVNDDAALEREADEMGSRALAVGGAELAPRDISVGAAGDARAHSPTLQRTSGDPGKAAAHQAADAIVQRVEWEDVKDSPDIRIEPEGGGYVAYFRGERAGDLELYRDEQGREWINNIRTLKRFQQLGIGLSLLNAAVEEHGRIFAATGLEADDEENNDDTRHLSPEGAALVDSAERNGILRPEWCFNPAYENEMHGEEEDHGSEEEEDAGEVNNQEEDFEQDPEQLEESGESEEEEEEEEVEEDEATCAAVIVLDDSNTEGFGYQYWADLTNLGNGRKITIEFNATIAGEEDLNTDMLEQKLSNITGKIIHLAEWSVDYTD